MTPPRNKRPSPVISIFLRHFIQEGKEKAGHTLLLKGTDFIENNYFEAMFGDFKGLHVYRLVGDLLHLKGNIYFEA
jgi:hypothetical protein